MSSRLAKSTSKFRPVKPQPKKQGSTPTVSAPAASAASQVTAPSGSSSAPSPAPTPASSAPNDSTSIPADVFSAVAAADNHAQAPPPLPPAATSSTSITITPSITDRIPEPPTQNEPPTTSIQPSLPEPQPQASTSSQSPPTKKVTRIPGVIAGLSPRKSTPVVSTPAAALSSTQKAPSTSQDDTQSTSQLAPPPASGSRQGTPISFGGSTFGVGSWLASEPTQASAAPPASAQSSGIPDSQATLVDSASQKQPPSKEVQPGISIDKESTVAPSSTAVPVASRSTAISPAEPGASSAAPQATSISHALPPLPTPLPASSSVQPLPPLLPGHPPSNEDETDHIGDQDAEGEEEGDIPVPEEGADAVTATKKKRVRQPAKGRATATAKGKKAAAKPRSKGKERQEVGADEDGEDGTEGAVEEGGGGEEEEAASVQGAVKKRPAKRKAPAKSKKKAKKKKRTPAEGDASGDEKEDAEYDEEGNLIYEPWEISKAHPGYSLNTRDIYAAVGVDLPESFDFRTAQDIADAIDEDENDEDGEREPVEGEEEQDHAERDEEDQDDYQEDDENGEEGTTPWAPFKGKAVDPTITTMKQLTEDTGRGRITPKLITSMTSKISAKQKVKVARERMKLRVALKKAGLDPEAIERRLDQEMETIMGGGILEFTEDDRSAPVAGHLIGSGRAQTEEASVRDDEDGSRQGTPYGGHINGNGQQPLFRPEENSDEEDHRNRQYDEDGNEIYPEEEEDGYEGMVESRYAPQMRFVDGQFVLDESSTQIVRGTDARDGFAVMEDTHDSRKINSASWGKRGKASRWTMADTDLFYEGLTQFGTDFELISRMFSNRTRRQIKAKFVREEKINSDRLEEALSGKKKIDINFYERMTKLDFRNGAVPADPMAQFYDGLPTAESAVKLESNRDASPGQELDLAALLRKKKEDTAGLGGWENSRAPREFDGEGQEAIPEEEIEGEEAQGYEGEHEEGEHADEEMQGQYDEQSEIPYRSPTPEQEEEPFSFSGGIQLRVSG